MKRLRHFVNRIGQHMKGRWRLLLYLTIAIAVGIYFFAILRIDPNFTAAIVAFSTLILALVAAFSINANLEIAKKRREEELAREKRERDERLLDEIRDWAINILAIINEYKQVNLGKLVDLHTRVITAKATIPNITAISKGFDQKFVSLVDSACDEMNSFTRLINELYIKNIRPRWDRVGNGWTVTDRDYERVDTPSVSDELEPIFTSLIEEAAKIKATL